LPARSIIIHGTSVGNKNLNSSMFNQMAGRAGRLGLDN